MRRLLSWKEPLTSNPQHILANLLNRKAVEYRNYEHVRIPDPKDIEWIASNLSKQLQTLLDNSLFATA